MAGVATEVPSSNEIFYSTLDRHSIPTFALEKAGGAGGVDLM